MGYQNFGGNIIPPLVHPSSYVMTGHLYRKPPNIIPPEYKPPMYKPTNLLTLSPFQI